MDGVATAPDCLFEEPDMSFEVPDAGTLPTVDRPLRLADLDDL